MADEMVIDTSSILAMVKEDEDAQRELHACEGKMLFAPESVRWEIVNALRQGVYKRFITPDIAQNAFEAALALPIQYIEVDQRAALRMALSFPKLLAYDAFVLQCARELGASLLTSEKDQAGRMPAYARQLGILLAGEHNHVKAR